MRTKILILPEDKDLWINWTQEELLIRGRMYWADFSSGAESDNKESVSVTISKNQVVNADSLEKILEQIAKEEWP